MLVEITGRVSKGVEPGAKSCPICNRLKLVFDRAICSLITGQLSTVWASASLCVIAKDFEELQVNVVDGSRFDANTYAFHDGSCNASSQ